MLKKLLTAGVMLALVAAVLVGGSSVASAQSMSLCQTVDALVLAGVIAPDKVAAAKAAAGCGATAPVASYTFTRNLTIGSTGADVTALQTKLGVTPATGYFGAITKAAVVAYQTANGISATGYVGPITLAALNYVAPVVGTPVTPSTPSTPVVSGLNGGAGDLDVSVTSTDVENSLKEGEEDVNVLGFKAEADGSDIQVTSVKVTLKNTSSTDGSSEKLSNYLDEVSIYMGSKKVGSVDVSDFTREAATPDTFSKTISLSGAVVDEGDDVKFYVAVSAVSNIDTEDLVAELNVVVDTVRFTDATGAILTASLPSAITTGEDFSFDDVTTDDDIDIKSSSANPDNETVAVEDDSTSDEVLALVFKLDVDDDSSDVMITSIPVTLTVAAGGVNADSVEDVIDGVVVTVNGNDYDADLTTDGVVNGSGTATYTVDFDDDEFTIEAGDVVDVKVTLTFNEQDEEANYAQNTTVVASVNGSNIDAETSEDDITVTGGTKTGATLTLNTSGAVLSSISWTKAEGTNAASIDLFFTLEADQNDITGFEKADVVEATKTNISGDGVLTLISGDATETSSGVFTISEGDSANFRVRYTVTTTGGEVKLSTINGQVVPDAKKLSPTAYYQ